MRIKKKNIFFAVVLLVLMRPSPAAPLGPETSSKIFDLLIISIATCLVISQKKYIDPGLTRSAPARALILLSVIEMLSFFAGAVDHKKYFQDAIEFTRWLAYLPLLALGYTAAKANPDFLVKSYERSLWILAALSIAFFFNFFGVESELQSVYEMGKSRGLESDSGVRGLWRLASTFSNPNYFGIHAAIAVCALVSFSRIGERVNYPRLLLAAIFVFMVIVSGSRTALIALLVSVTCLIMIRSDYLLKRSALTALLSSLALTFVFTFVVIYGVNYLIENTWRFSNIDNMYLSMGLRFEIWREMFESGASSFIYSIIGQGANRTEFVVADNNYILMFYKNGLIGFCVFLWLITSILHRSIIVARGSTAFRSFGLATFGAVLVVAISAMTSVPFQHSQLSMIFFILVGASAAVGARKGCPS